jgi:hypothetical protein
MLIKMINISEEFYVLNVMNSGRLMLSLFENTHLINSSIYSLLLILYFLLMLLSIFYVVKIFSFRVLIARAINT